MSPPPGVMSRPAESLAAESLAAESLADPARTRRAGRPHAGPPHPGLELPCREAQPDLFFADTPAEVERAKALCHGCPVRTSCLSGALRRQEPWGVWGGQLFANGVVIPRKRPRGRPRKEAAA